MRAIDADALKQKLQNVANKAKGKRMIAKLDEVMEVLIKHLDDIPTIEPEHTIEEYMYGQDMGNPENGRL